MFPGADVGVVLVSSRLHGESCASAAGDRELSKKLDAKTSEIRACTLETSMNYRAYGISLKIELNALDFGFMLLAAFINVNFMRRY